MNNLHTIFTGKRFIHLDSTSSTNLYALDLLTKTNPIDGTVILADNQTKGKGQMGNNWYSEQGKSLTLSIIYKTNFLKAMEQAYLNFALSIGIIEAIGRFVTNKADLKLKWPNDLFYKNTKFGGILIENSIRGALLEHTVIGIGINVEKMDFPAEINATFVNQFSDSKVSIELLTKAICEEVEKSYLKLRQGSVSFASIKSLYESFLWGKGKESGFLLNDESPIIATIIGVDTYGRLLLNIDGEEKCFDNKALTFTIND